MMARALLEEDAFAQPAAPHRKGETMKTRTSIALAVIAGFGLGGLSIHTLHAQAKPPVYTVAEIDVGNNDAYMKEYAPRARRGRRR